MRKCHSHDGDKHVQESVQQDRRMETIPRAQRERRRRREPRGPDRRQKTRGESKEKQEERETGDVSRNRVRFARVPRFSWSAHTWPRNACSQKTRGTAIVLSAVAVKSTRGSLHDRTLSAGPLHPVPLIPPSCPVPFLVVFAALFCYFAPIFRGFF